ncbi:amino acid ABC transporter substrate-binding protein [Halobium palmae]|uniref:Amino acid ABC transporter substrate-binding protein n=1 Tax=Halobium palmae TaxID=1776492 RepID=A0ABD5RW28_9EURY
MPIRSRRRFVKAAGASGLAFAAGCTAIPGSGGGGDDTITIGATVSRSGSFSGAGEDVETAYELGRDLINENGGILDREVELIIKDDESSPDGVREGLQEIASNNDLDLIWGTFGSLLVAAAASFAENQEIPMLSANFAYMEPHTKNNYDWTFAPFPKSRDMGNGALKLANMTPEGERPKRVGIWQTNTGWGAELGRVWSEKLGDNGYEVVLNERFQIGTQDFSTLISKTKSADVEYLLGNPSPAGGITAAKQMQQASYVPKLSAIERAATITTWLKATGKAGLFLTSTPGWVPGLTGNGNQELLDAFRSQEGVASDAYPAPTVGGSYNVTQATKQAIEAAGSTEADAVREALLNTEFETVIGDFRFDENGMPVEGDLAPPMGQWQDGMLRLVLPADVDSEVSTDLQYPAPPYGDR